MKTLLTTVILLLGITVFGQSDPIPLSYGIGKFKITPQQDRVIKSRFAQLDANKTYMVYISGSADFLGGKDNNITLSNKRVKFAEYHLLQNYNKHRLIIKLDSKGEMNASGLNQTPKGIQEHRMVYIHIQEYNGQNPYANDNNSGFDRVVATPPAADAESLSNVPRIVATEQSIGGFKVEQNNSGANGPVENTQVNKEIIGMSETAQIERAKEEARRAVEAKQDQPINREAGTLVANNQNDAGLTSATLSTNNSNANGDDHLRKFDGEGTYAVGEKLLLSDMNFRPGSHYLRPSSIPSLRKLINVLEDNPNLSIEIRGHICCHPDYSVHPDGYDREAGNHKLSYNRAQNIKEYLEKNGISGKRVTAVGMGAKERLVYPEETDEDRIKNRRVEIIIRKI